MSRTVSFGEELFRSLQKGSISSYLTVLGSIAAIVIFAQVRIFSWCDQLSWALIPFEFFSTLKLYAQLFLQDDKVPIHHLIPAGSLCANQEDMFDDTKRLCQVVENCAKLTSNMVHVFCSCRWETNTRMRSS